MQLYFFCSQRSATQFKPGWVSFAIIIKKNQKKLKQHLQKETHTVNITMALYIKPSNHPAGQSLVARFRQAGTSNNILQLICYICTLFPPPQALQFHNNPSRQFSLRANSLFTAEGVFDQNSSTVLVVYLCHGQSCLLPIRKILSKGTILTWNYAGTSAGC